MGDEGKEGSKEEKEGSEAATGNYTCYIVRRRGQQARAALTDGTKGGRITKAAMQQQPTIMSSAPSPKLVLCY